MLGHYRLRAGRGATDETAARPRPRRRHEPPILIVVTAASAVFYGTPLLYAALGELLAERSGVLNLGVEGMMLVGAVTGFWTGRGCPAGPHVLAGRLVAARPRAAMSR